jgi:hypothetical protein
MQRWETAIRQQRAEMEARSQQLPQLHAQELQHLREQLLVTQNQLAELTAASTAPAHAAAAPTAAAPAVAPIVNLKLAAKPDKFTGLKDSAHARVFLFQLRQYFAAVGLTDPRHQAVAAGSFLSGPAATWWQAVVESAEQKGEAISFDTFSHALQQQYEPINAVQVARDKLHVLYQRKDLRAYTAAFRSLVTVIPDLSEATKLDHYLRGLSEQLQVHLVGKHMDTYEDAIRLATEYDARLNRTVRRPWLLGAGGASSSYAGSHAAPMELGALSARPRQGDTPPQGSAGRPANPSRGPPNGSGAGSPPGARRPLTPADKAYLARMGACFYCRQRTDPPHVARNCPLRRQGGNRSA